MYNKTTLNRKIFAVCAIAAFGVIAISRAHAQWAAIYHSPESNSIGKAWGFNDKRGAEMRALGECEHRSKKGGCQRAVVLHGKGCGALAVATNVRGGYGGTAKNLEEAKYKALNECMKAYGAKCNINSTVCQ
jgi:hypothetical protein